ncbi:UDP-N-acetylglucosamine 2-epimerase [Litchfieldia salsa]|uniref:UDP-N-acetylglucosamine 2-epimerase (Non-hydrolysing)/GDP/UDP-N,N'-diacetylbacillosamine 2-epimerase (Hydrolysing) n=1 Tax=Litchfieldia salsa TaxID=930152 RepID=A0A1H0WEU6_9BACI|nr:UDP-N-acetylglucosamine 2-epimerase [Litchfieldia salsa]SDP88806.1 UDP-N-acetylglucosamine 2-epimerase (non-hydrolysing)/GDP/UDP-N,N'-diacetylbacillosamine 2-epimerase (hydrolysing) [Litchfieldia salsa]
MKRRVCVVTGTRAEYGLLYWILRELQHDEDIELQIVVTGMHMSPEFGLTYKQIERDGFMISEKLEMLISSDTSSGITKSMGLGLIGFADMFDRLKPNLLILLGDRFEALAAAQSAMISRIPIAHIHGGEITMGAIDDSIRHAITKMSNLHFVSTEGHRRRVIQLGEQPSTVYNVGAPGIESIEKNTYLTRNQLETELGMEFARHIFLITYHPETLSNQTEQSVDQLLLALEEIKDTTFIFTKANADEKGRLINQKVEDFVKKHRESSSLYSSLGQKKYLSLLKEANLVIGNSSSGLLEAPYLSTPTVNIGDRQKGRECPPSVINSKPRYNEILKAINKALDFDFVKNDVRIFGSGNISKKIVKIIKNHQDLTSYKKFYDWEE